MKNISINGTREINGGVSCRTLYCYDRRKGCGVWEVIPRVTTCYLTTAIRRMILEIRNI